MIMKTFKEYIDNRIDEGLLDLVGVHVPTVEEIMWMIVKCILIWELIKYGAKFSLGFMKGLFVSGSNEFGAMFGEKFRNKLIGGIKNKIKQRKIKQPLTELINLKKEVTKGSISQEDAKEKIKEISNDLIDMDDELFEMIVAKCEEFTKDEHIVNKISKALNI